VRVSIYEHVCRFVRSEAFDGKGLRRQNFAYLSLGPPKRLDVAGWGIDSAPIS